MIQVYSEVKIHMYYEVMGRGRFNLRVDATEGSAARTEARLRRFLRISRRHIMKTVIAIAAFCAIATAAHASIQPRVHTPAGTDIGYVTGQLSDGSLLFQPAPNSGIGGIFPVLVPEWAFTEDNDGNLTSAINTDRLGEMAFEQQW